MSISQGIYSYNTGRDLNAKAIWPNGVSVNLQNLVSVEAKPDYTQIDGTLINGVNLHADLPKRWQGKMSLWRRDQQVDDLVYFTESAWLDDGAYATGSIFFYINEADGSLTVEAFENVSFQYSDGGTWAGDKEVVQTIDFTGSRRNVT